ncbi:TRAPP II complex [Babesia duncani]|uniref:TRAPP II complex n=1 Tax=Babesia duncani TaxID=323732 RepID=A0AAD9PM33_9APIC|nr:TRAPP II complex [Babesia duncani]
MVKIPTDVDYKRHIYRGLKLLVVKSHETPREAFAHVVECLTETLNLVHLVKTNSKSTVSNNDVEEPESLLACVNASDIPLVAMLPMNSNPMVLQEGEQAVKGALVSHSKHIKRMLKHLKDVEKLDIDYCVLQSPGDVLPSDGIGPIFHFESIFAAIVVHTVDVNDVIKLQELQNKYKYILQEKYPLVAIHIISACSQGLHLFQSSELLQANQWLMHSATMDKYYINMTYKNWSDALLGNSANSNLIFLYNPEKFELEMFLPELVQHLVQVLIYHWVDCLDTKSDLPPDPLDVKAIGHPSAMAKVKRYKSRGDLYLLLGNVSMAIKEYERSITHAINSRNFIYKGASEFASAIGLMSLHSDTATRVRQSSINETLCSLNDAENLKMELENSPVDDEHSNASDDDILHPKEVSPITQRIAVLLQHAFYSWKVHKNIIPNEFGLLIKVMIDWYRENELIRLTHYYIGAAAGIMDKEQALSFYNYAFNHTRNARYSRKPHLYRYMQAYEKSRANLTNTPQPGSDFTNTPSFINDDHEVLSNDNTFMEFDLKSAMDTISQNLHFSADTNEFCSHAPKWHSIKEAWLKLDMQSCTRETLLKLAFEILENVLNGVIAHAVPSKRVWTGILDFNRCLKEKGIAVPRLFHCVLPLLHTTEHPKEHHLNFRVNQDPKCLYTGGYQGMEMRPLILLLDITLVPVKDEIFEYDTQVTQSFPQVCSKRPYKLLNGANHVFKLVKVINSKYIHLKMLNKSGSFLERKNNIHNVGNYACALVKAPAGLEIPTPKYNDKVDFKTEKEEESSTNLPRNEWKISIGRLYQIEMRFSNPLPVDIVIEDIKLITMGTNIELHAHNIMVPASVKWHYEIVDIIANSPGTCKIVGLEFTILGIRCTQVLVSNADFNLEDNPWLLLDITKQSCPPSIGVVMATSAPTSPRTNGSTFNNQESLQKPTITIKGRYRYWNGIRMPSLNDITLPQKVMHCPNRDCTTCTYYKNFNPKQEPHMEKLIEGEHRLMYIVLKNTTASTVYRDIQVYVKSATCKLPKVSQYDARTSDDKEIQQRRNKIHEKMCQVNNTKCIVILSNRAICSRANSQHYIHASQNWDESFDTTTLNPGDELLVPMIYTATRNCHLFEFHVKAGILHNNDVALGVHHVEFNVVEGIGIGSRGMHLFPNLSFNPKMTLDHCLGSPCYSEHVKTRLRQSCHVFDGKNVTLMIPLSNETESNFVCQCRLANNQLVSSMGSESLWSLQVPRIGYMHAKAMDPNLFFQFLEAYLSLSWTCFPNNGGSIAIECPIDPNEKMSKFISSKFQIRRGIMAVYKRNQVWRLHGIQELASANFFYSRIPKALHANLHHVIESLITLEIIITDTGKEREYEQVELSTGVVECICCKPHENLKLELFASVCGNVSIPQYEVLIIPYMYGTNQDPTGLKWNGALHMHSTVTLASNKRPNKPYQTLSSGNNLVKVAQVDIFPVAQGTFEINAAILLDTKCYWHHKPLILHSV